MFRQTALLLLIVSPLLPRAALALDTREIYKTAEPSVVVVLAADAKGEKNNLGSGVIISPTEVVTSCKFLEAAADIVITQGNALRKAKLRFRDSERDLCQLHIDEPLPSGVPAARPAAATEAEAGQELYAIGSPRGMERTISRTMVSGMRDIPGSKVRLIQIDALLSGAMTGGGIFDQDAKLVGIIVAQFRQVENTSYAAPARWIADLSNRSIDQIATAAVAPPQSPKETSKAQTRADTLPASNPRIGDRWKYKITYGKQDVGNATIEIVDAREKSVKELVRYDRSTGFARNRDVDLGFDPIRFQSTVALPGGYQIIELAPYAPPETQFVPGKTWIDIPGDFAPQGGSNTQVSKSHVRVVGREKVRFPAGEFTAWKVETLSDQMYAVNQFFVAKCIYWYAPESKRTVKMHLTYKSPMDVLSNTQIYEPVAFEPAK